MRISVAMKRIIARSPHTPKQWLTVGATLLLAWRWMRRNRTWIRAGVHRADARRSALTLVHVRRQEVQHAQPA